MYLKTHKIHYTDPGHFDKYYMNQVGSGMAFYRGSPRIQRGYGLGGLLGGLFRSAIPFLKKGAAAIGKQALQTGMEIADDVMGGQNVKTAAKRRMKQAGRQLVTKAGRKIQKGGGKGRGNRRKKTNRKSNTKTRRTNTRRAPPRRRGIKRKKTGKNVRTLGNKRRRKTYNDVFG